MDNGPNQPQKSLQERLADRRADLRRRMLVRRSHLQRTLAERQRLMRDRIVVAKAHMKRDIRSNPAKWTAIAAAAGLAVGLLGRLALQRRSRRRTPRLVIVEV